MKIKCPLIFALVCLLSVQGIAQNYAPLVTVSNPGPNGSGSSVHFTVQAIDPNGVNDIGWLGVGVGTGWLSVPGCFVLIYPNQNYIVLLSDSGTWMGPYTIGSSFTASNSYCDVPMSSFSRIVFPSGGANGAGSLTGDFVMNFKSPFVGQKYTYAIASDLTGWYGGGNPVSGFNVTAPGGGLPPDQVIAFTRDSAPAPDLIDLPAMISLTQANYNPSDPGALSIYHVNDPVHFRVRSYKPFTQVWVQRRTIQTDGVNAGVALIQTVCSHSTGQENEGLEDSINGACLLGTTDSTGFLEWNGNIYSGLGDLHYLGLTTVKFYVGPQTLNPIRPGITNGPMNEDNSIGALVYFVQGPDNLPVPPVW